MNENVQELIQSRLITVTDPAERKVSVLEEEQAQGIASKCGLKIKDVYNKAMELGIYPYRYLRNMETISLEEQLKLSRSRVAVVGAGGLGGNVILLLARLGIGQLVVVDYDVFDETNLNRQALSNVNSLGKSKSGEAVELVGSINPGVEVFPYQVKLNTSNAFEMLDGAEVVVDALDNIPDRFVLEKLCRKLGVPLVHGALAGFEGQVMTIFPDDPGLKHLYGNESESSDRSKNPESILGVPAPTPSLIATLQVMEVIKIILKRGKIFRNVMLHVDLETGEMNEFVFDKHV
ncbi:MAG: HesA/MoeB/ThiF family protein [Deltaproteobacteria bacterium]|nr:HesA/MoeB/ThiF family protein [Deltaproteobacteria bacterium]